MRRSSRRRRDVRSPSVFGRQQRPATGMLEGGRGLSLRELAVFEGGGGVLLGLVVVALLVEVRRLMVVVGGGVMMRRRVVMVFGRLMFRSEGQSRGSLPGRAVAGPREAVVDGIEASLGGGSTGRQPRNLLEARRRPPTPPVPCRGSSSGRRHGTGRDALGREALNRRRRRPGAPRREATSRPPSS